MKIFGLGLLLALGAFAQKIEIEFDQAVDFSKFKTFAIRAARLTSRNPSLNSELIRKRINADIQKYLEAKGSPSCHPARPISTFATRWVRCGRQNSRRFQRVGAVGVHR